MKNSEYVYIYGIGRILDTDRPEGERTAYGIFMPTGVVRNTLLDITETPIPFSTPELSKLNFAYAYALAGESVILKEVYAKLAGEFQGSLATPCAFFEAAKEALSGYHYRANIQENDPEAVLRAEASHKRFCSALSNQIQRVLLYNDMRKEYDDKKELDKIAQFEQQRENLEQELADLNSQLREALSEMDKLFPIVSQLDSFDGDRRHRNAFLSNFGKTEQEVQEIESRYQVLNNRVSYLKTNIHKLEYDIERLNTLISRSNGIKRPTHIATYQYENILLRRLASSYGAKVRSIQRLLDSDALSDVRARKRVLKRHGLDINLTEELARERLMSIAEEYSLRKIGAEHAILQNLEGEYSARLEISNKIHLAYAQAKENLQLALESVNELRNQKELVYAELRKLREQSKSLRGNQKRVATIKKRELKAQYNELRDSFASARAAVLAFREQIASIKRTRTEQMLNAEKEAKKAFVRMSMAAKRFGLIVESNSALYVSHSDGAEKIDFNKISQYSSNARKSIEDLKKEPPIKKVSLDRMLRMPYAPADNIVRASALVSLLQLGIRNGIVDAHAAILHRHSEESSSVVVLKNDDKEGCIVHRFTFTRGSGDNQIVVGAYAINPKQLQYDKHAIEILSQTGHPVKSRPKVELPQQEQTKVSPVRNFISSLSGVTRSLQRLNPFRNRRARAVAGILGGIAVFMGLGAGLSRISESKVADMDNPQVAVSKPAQSSTLNPSDFAILHDDLPNVAQSKLRVLLEIDKDWLLSFKQPMSFHAYVDNKVLEGIISKYWAPKIKEVLGNQPLESKHIKNMLSALSMVQMLHSGEEAQDSLNMGYSNLSGDLVLSQEAYRRIEQAVKPRAQKEGTDNRSKLSSFKRRL